MRLVSNDVIHIEASAIRGEGEAARCEDGGKRRC